MDIRRTKLNIVSLVGKTGNNQIITYISVYKSVISKKKNKTGHPKKNRQKQSIHETNSNGNELPPKCSVALLTGKGGYKLGPTIILAYKISKDLNVIVSNAGSRVM